MSRPLHAPVLCGHRDFVACRVVYGLQSLGKTRKNLNVLLLLRSTTTNLGKQLVLFPAHEYKHVAAPFELN